MPRRTLIVVFVVALLLTAGLGLVTAGDDWTGTGEVLDMNCYKREGAKGEGHAGCAKRCLGSGSPMGLLTEDDEVVLLVADEENQEPYDQLVGWAGQMVEVSGSASEEGGKTKVTVASAAPAES